MFQFKQMSFNNLLMTLIGFGALFAFTMPGTLPTLFYTMIYSLQMLFFLTARIQQIKINYQNKSTGVLSPITLCLSWAGNLARLFTVIVDLGFSDMQVVLFTLTYLIFNFLPFAQYLLYMNSPKSENNSKKVENSNEIVSKRKIKTVQSKKESLSDSVVTKRKRSAKRD